MIPQNVIQDTIKDKDFILSEVARIRNKLDETQSLKEAFGDGHMGLVNLSSKLKHPETGHDIYCGVEAFRRFSIIATRVINSLPDREAWDAAVLSERLSDTFIPALLADGAEDFGLIENWLNAAVRFNRSRQRKRTHYVPCRALAIDGTTSYTLIGITFTLTGAFLQQYENALQSYEKARDTLSERGRRNATPSQQKCIAEHSKGKKTGATEAFRKFTDGIGSIATIEVPKCDFDVSQGRADAAVRIALASIKLFLEERDKAAAVQHGEDPKPQSQTARLHSSGGKMFRTTGQTKFGGPRVQTEWKEYLDREAEPLLRVCELLVEQELEGAKRPYMYQAALRAITWYADAVSDSNPETSIVKCVTAIEAIVLTERRLARAAFVIRGSLLACRPENPLATTIDFANHLYSIRSDIAHGNIEALSKSIKLTASKALDFSRRAVLQFLALCHHLKPFGSKYGGTREDLLICYDMMQAGYAPEVSPLLDQGLSSGWASLNKQTETITSQ
jgi:hypothetical protein